MSDIWDAHDKVGYCYKALVNVTENSFEARKDFQICLRENLFIKGKQYNYK